MPQYLLIHTHELFTVSAVTANIPMALFSILPSTNPMETTTLNKHKSNKKHKKSKKHKHKKHDRQVQLRDSSDNDVITSSTHTSTTNIHNSTNDDPIDLTNDAHINETDTIDTTDLVKSNKKRKRKRAVQSAIESLNNVPSSGQQTRQTIGIIPLQQQLAAGNTNMNNNEDTTNHVSADRGSSKYGLLYTESGLMQGRWSNIEKQILSDAIQKYQLDHNITDDIFLLHLTKRSRLLMGAIREIAQSLPRRTEYSVYGYILRNYDPERVKGIWSNDELLLLHELINSGQSFAQIHKIIKRTPTDIKNKWLQIKNPNYKKGNWTIVEDARLLKLVKKQSKSLNDNNNTNNSRPPKSGVMWSIISDQMIDRSMSDCRNRYYSVLYKKLMLNNITFDDDYQLIQNVWLSGAEDSSEVRWDRMSDKWPATDARMRFQKLSYNVPQHSLRSFDDIITYLHDEFNAQYMAINQGIDDDSNNTVSSCTQLSAADQQFIADADAAAEQQHQQDEQQLHDHSNDISESDT